MKQSYHYLLIRSYVWMSESTECLRGYKNHLKVACKRTLQGIACGSDNKESACNVGDLGSISGLGRSP